MPECRVPTKLSCLVNNVTVSSFFSRSVSLQAWRNEDGKRGRSKMRIQRETMDPWCLRAFLFFVLATNENAVVFLVKIIIYVIANAAFHCTFITCTAHFFFFWAIYKMLFFHIPQGLAYLFVKVVIYLSLFSSTWNIKRQQKLQTSTNVLSYCVDTELKLKEF